MSAFLPLCAFCMFILCFWSLLDRWKGRLAKRPPGPIRLPLLGCLLYMLPAVMDSTKTKSKTTKSILSSKYMKYKPAYIIMDELSKKFGPLTSLQFGVNHAIIVSSCEYAKELLCREEFSHRFADGWFVERSFGEALGLIFNNDKPYREIKCFTIKTLKDFGFGKKQSMETAVEDELIDFLHDFQQKVEAQGSVVHMEHMFTLPVLNILWDMVAGIRFSYDDKKLRQLISIVEEISRSFDIGGNILMAFPFLRFIAPELTGHAHQMRLYSKLHQFFRDIFQERVEEGSFSGNPKDFIDIFLQEMEKQTKLKPNGNLFTEKQFIMVCLDLFTAGSETTANTLDFAILYMLLNPSVQKKVQSEIDEVIGPSRLPNMKDRQLMPYTEATLLETQRMCNVIPLVHRVTKSDTKLGNYHIKKNDVMIVNLHSIHMEEKVWGDPAKFRPERFIDDKGNLCVPSSFLPFGMGKRICIGEALAKLTLFTFFTSILQRFSFNVSPQHGKPALSLGKGFTIGPEPFYALVKPRL